MMAAAMGAFGERLQREREMRGITLEQMSEATKITTRCLRALEEEEFDRLPGGIFNKGFVRAYARHLGIDEDQAVTDFVTASGGEKEQPLPDPPIARAVALGQRAENNLNWQALGILALLVLALAAVAWKIGPAAWHGAYAKVSASISSPSAAAGPEKAAGPASPSKAAPPSEPPPQSAVAAPDQNKAEAHVAPAPPASQRVEETPAAPPPPAPVAEKPATPKPEPVAVAAKASPTPVSPPVADAAPAASRSFVVHVRATQDAWVQIVADGKLVSEGVLVPPAEKRVPAAKEVVIKTGNAAGVEVSFNGQPLPSLGEENQMATVTFTAAGLRR